MPSAARGWIPLESGDHLTRAEFHHRYYARKDIQRAELIEGVVYVPSPVRHAFHGKQQRLVSGWLGAYQALAPGVDGGDGSTIFMDDESEVQPDTFLFRDPSPEGAIRMDEEGYLHGRPDLIVEIAASSAAYDLHEKMALYRRAGVQEYIVWQVYEQRIDWFRLHGEQYEPLQPDERGVITGEDFPSLRLNVPAMLAGDLANVLAAIAPPPTG